MNTESNKGSIQKIISALSTRGNWCFILRHRRDQPKPTDNDLVNYPQYYRCKYCTHNMGKVE